MAQPYNCLRLSGTMPGGEVWSVNPKFISVGGTPVSEYQDLLQWATNINGLNSGNIVPAEMLALLSTAVTINTVRTEYYGSDGKLEQAAEINRVTPAVGTGNATKPFQTALVFSLRTGRPGRSYRGRLYWPAVGASISTITLRLSPSNTLLYAQTFVSWIKAVSGATPQDRVIFPAVVSQTLGVASTLTSVQVGDVLDVQRRRRDALQEGYSSANVPPAP